MSIQQSDPKVLNSGRTGRPSHSNLATRFKVVLSFIHPHPPPLVSCKHGMSKGLTFLSWRNRQGGWTLMMMVPPKNMYFRSCFFPLLASWFLGFVASWLLGFSASWLFGFSASGLFGFLLVYAAMRLLVAFWLWLFASSAFPVPLQQVAFWLLRLCAGLCGFWRLWLFASWLLHPFIGFWIWLPASRASPVPPYLNHHFFRHHGGGGTPNPPAFEIFYRDLIAPLVESSILRTSWGGCRPPQPPRCFLDFLQRLNCTPI